MAVTPTDSTRGRVDEIIGSMIGSGTGQADEPPVPMWKHTARPEGVGAWWKTTPQTAQEVYAGATWASTRDEAESSWLDMSDADRLEFKKLAVDIGAASEDASAADLFGVWASAVSKAAQYNLSQGDKVTKYVSPWEVMTRLSIKQVAQDNGAYDGFVGTRTSRNFQKFTPEQVAGNVEGVFLELMGRAPTPEELNVYVNVLNRAATSAPTVTSTTIDQAGNQTSTTSGGLDAAAVIRGEAQGDPETSRVQAATTYFEALQQALGATA